MKKFLLLCAACIFTLMLFAQVDSVWYKVFTGKVEGMDAVLHLQRAGSKYNGYLWFTQTPKPMPCYVTLQPDTDSVTITANANPVSFVLSGLTPSNKYEGEVVISENDEVSKRGTFLLAETADTVFTRFDYVYTTGSANMPQRLNNQSRAGYFSGMLWPRPLSNKFLETALRSYVNGVVGNADLQAEPGKKMVANKNKFLNEFKAEVAKLTPAETKDMGMSYSRDAERMVSVMYEDEKVITLADFSYAYTGGAHGNYGTALVNFDKRNGKMLKLADILTPAGIATLPKMLETALRRQYNLDKTKTLEQNGVFVKKVKPSNSFYFTKGNLGFLYSPYEIMAYAVGEPNLFIPAAEIASYLKPGFR